MRRRNRRTVAILVGVALLVGFPPALAKPGKPKKPKPHTETTQPPPPVEDRVVHGRIGRPTGQRFATPPVGDPAVDEALGAALPARAHAGCAGTVAGFDDTSWVIDEVSPGKVFELTADAGSWNDDFDIAFYETLAPCNGALASAWLPHRNRAGDERAVVPDGAQVVVVILVTGSEGAAVTYRELADRTVTFRSNSSRPTVVAVIEPASAGNALLDGNGFSPYHVDFLGNRHPANTDNDATNDINFTADPATYIPGYPTGVPAVSLSLPQGDDDEVAPLASADAAAWAGMEGSSADETHLYRLSGTKVVGAVRFGEAGGGILNGLEHNDGHGTKSASVAGGNVHGACPTCVFVLVLFEGGDDDAALEWVAQQSWIDVVSQSRGKLGHASGPTTFPHEVIRPAVERGQTWIWASGNGYENAFVVPNPTYTWGYHGGDWNVVVGAVYGIEDRGTGSGIPVDIAAHGSPYPSAGGTVAGGKGTHTGTSNAAPVVAGVVAETIRLGRLLLGDATGVPDAGVVAAGDPRPCEGPVPDCPLQDGRLTRAEVQSVLFGNVLPAPRRFGPPATDTAADLPTDVRRTVTPSASASVSQGHGVVHGRLDPPAFVAEQRRFLDALRGAVGPLHRPPGERTWMTVDSKCRQRLWGSWDEGYYTGVEPTFDPMVDQPAMALDAACTQVPENALVGNLGFEDICVPGLRPPICVVWPL